MHAYLEYRVIHHNKVKLNNLVVGNITQSHTSSKMLFSCYFAHSIRIQLTCTCTIKNTQIKMIFFWIVHLNKAQFNTISSARCPATNRCHSNKTRHTVTSLSRHVTLRRALNQRLSTACFADSTTMIRHRKFRWHN